MTDKEDVESALKEKEKSAPFWQTVPPLIMVAGIVMLFLLLRSIQIDNESRNTYFLIILAVGVIIFLLSKGDKKEQIVSPKEAEILAERECERKLRWNQWPPMTQYHVGPISDLMHRDARGQYYNIKITITKPFLRPEPYVAKVMASGPERGFCTLVEAIRPLTGRGIPQEKDVLRIPEWVKRPEKYPILEKYWFQK